MKLKTIMDDKKDHNKNEVCTWAFRKTASNSTIYVGEAFFQKFYTIFDNNNSRMGFGIYHFGQEREDDDDELGDDED